MQTDPSIPSTEHDEIDIAVVVGRSTLETARALVDQVASRLGLDAGARNRVRTALTELLESMLAGAGGRLAHEVRVRCRIEGEAMFIEVSPRAREHEPLDPESSSLAIVTALMDDLDIAHDGTATMRKDLQASRFRPED